MKLVISVRDVPNIRFVFALVQNSAPNSVFIFGRIASSERIRIVSFYSAASDVYGRLHSVSASCSRSDRLIMETNEWERVMARQHAGPVVISEGHKEVVNIRTAGAASKCSASKAIRILIRPNSLKPLFGTPLISVHHVVWFCQSSGVDSAAVELDVFCTPCSGISVYVVAVHLVSVIPSCLVLPFLLLPL